MASPQISQNESFLQEQSDYSPQNESLSQEQNESIVSDVKQQNMSQIEQTQVLENLENNENPNNLNKSENKNKNQGERKSQNLILADSQQKSNGIDDSQEIIYQKQISQRHSIKKSSKLSPQSKVGVNDEQLNVIKPFNGIEKENSKHETNDHAQQKSQFVENQQRKNTRKFSKEDQLNSPARDLNTSKEIAQEEQEYQKTKQQEQLKNDQHVQFQNKESKTSDMNVIKTLNSTRGQKQIQITQAEQSKIKAIQDIMQKYNKMLEAARTEEDKQVLFQQISILNQKLKKIQFNINAKNNLTKIETSLIHGQPRDYQSSPTPIKDPIKLSLIEIFQFYSKQGFLSNKKATFEQLQQKSNSLSLPKFMYFCKDFGLVDMLLSIEKVQQISKELGYESQIKTSQKMVQKVLKYPLAGQKPNTATKQFLVEQFKKSSSNSQELTLEEFELCLQKIGSLLLNQFLDQLQFEIIDEKSQTPSSFQVLIALLEISKPTEYRKKMIIVGAPFDMRDQGEKVKVTQEQLKAKVSVPLTRRKQVLEQNASQPLVQNHQSPKLIQIQTSLPVDPQKTPGPKVTWDHLSAAKIEALNDNFDPKDLLQDSDFDDYEDQLYLNEYNLKGTNSTQLTNQQKVQTKIDNDGQEVQNHVRRITNARGIGYSQRYGLPTGNMGSTEKNKNKTEVKIYKGDFKNPLLRDRSGSTQRYPQDISVETYSRAQQLELQQKQKEAAIFQQVLRNQDQKVNKLNMKI